MKSTEYKDYAKSVNYNPCALDSERGRQAAAYPVTESTNGITYPNHGNSLDFAAAKGTSIYSATGGTVYEVDWGYADDYQVRQVTITLQNGSKRTGYYEIDASGKLKYDSSGNAVAGKPYANVVKIKTDDGAILIYAHMAYADEALVKVGDYIPIEWQIGTVGNTGNSMGDHLHFEARNTTNSIRKYLPK